MWLMITRNASRDAFVLNWLSRELERDSLPVRIQAARRGAPLTTRAISSSFRVHTTSLTSHYQQPARHLK